VALIHNYPVIKIMANPAAWQTVPMGTIVDFDIRRLAEDGELITNGFFAASVKQACYELRASNVVYETTEPRENKRLEVGAGGYVLRPQSSATLIVEERIALPNDVLARILTKGQLFSIGILPVCTYADPGFVGRLGITLSNASYRPVVIRPGQPIAKIEFSRLSQAVEQPYTGQHGFETEIWPIPTHLYATAADLKAAGVELNSDAEIARMYGPVVANIRQRVAFYERRIWLQIGITVISFAVLFAMSGQLGLVVSVITGVLANLATSFGFHLYASRKLNWPK
jgi:dCTP deaminase